MKRTLSLILCAALLLTSVCCMAGAEEAPISFPYTGEEVTFHGYAYTGKDQNPELPCIKAWKEHIGNINIDYEFAAYTDYQEKSKLMLATGEIPDILPIANVMSVVAQYGDTGMLLDFNQYLDYMPNLKKYLETYPNLNYVCNADGARYAIIGVQPIDYSGEGWFVNMDVLRAAGIEKAPDTFVEMLEDMRIIKAKDPSIVPFQTYWNINYTQQWMAYSIGAKNQNVVYFDTADNQWKATYREESAKRKELIELMHTLYSEGLVNSELATMSFEQEQAAIASGKWAFTAMYSGSPEMEIFKVQPGEALPFDIQPMTPPADENGVRRMSIAYQHDGLPGWGIVCSSQTKHPELLAAYMDQVVSKWGRDNFNYGIEGVTFDYIDGVPTLREGIDKAAYGLETQYEVWMVGMGPVARTSLYTLQQAANELNLKNFTEGKQEAVFEPAFAIFSAEDAAEKASLENDIATYVTENEAAFIYGLRDMNEWDAYVAELEGIADFDTLLDLYNNKAQIIVRDPARVWVAE